MTQEEDTDPTPTPQPDDVPDGNAEPEDDGTTPKEENPDA